MHGWWNLWERRTKNLEKKRSWGKIQGIERDKKTWKKNRRKCTVQHGNVVALRRNGFDMPCFDSFSIGISSRSSGILGVVIVLSSSYTICLSWSFSATFFVSYFYFECDPLKSCCVSTLAFLLYPLRCLTFPRLSSLWFLELLLFFVLKGYFPLFLSPHFVSLASLVS